MSDNGSGGHTAETVPGTVPGTGIMIDAGFRALIPPISPEELAQLEANILEHGCRDPLVTWNGVLVDGHNRHDICTRHGLGFRVVSIDLPDRDAAEDWIDANQLGRRNLTPDARRLLLGRRYNRQKKRDGERGPAKKPGQSDPALRTSESLAEKHGVSEATVRRAGKFAEKVEKTPELKEAVATGKPVLQVERELREQRREARRQENAAKVAAVESPVEAVESGARFATIVIDPPWDWGDEGDVNQLGRAKPDYATMGIDDLLALPVPDLTDADCHLYLWITNRSLPKGFRLIERWGFRYITALTWVKPSFGMGNYFRGQTEHVLFAVKGSQPLKRKDAATVFHAPRGPGGHSSKPEEFYELVESCSPGPYLEMFARADRDGWVSWGEEGERDAA